ncbi:L3MBTL4 [Acrasis kona]|uniref:L3MBTL4 n=1 Tax=Acrasis kona TaxID=1008807 RepID=A0AAW2Z645_9EUKA
MKRSNSEAVHNPKRTKIEEPLRPTTPFSVRLLVRKELTDLWTERTTSLHAGRNVINNVENTLVHSVPDNYFAVEVVNNSGREASAEILIEGRSTITTNGSKYSASLGIGGTHRCDCFQVNGVKFPIKFNKSITTNERSDRNVILDPEELDKIGTIKITIWYSRCTSTRKEAYIAEAPETLPTSKTIMDEKTKFAGVHCGTGQLIRTNHKYINISNVIFEEKAAQFLIVYRDTTGFIHEKQLEKWNGCDFSGFSIFSDEPDSGVIDISDDENEEEDNSVQDEFNKRIEAIDNISKWSPKQLLHWVKMKEDIKETQMCFKRKNINGKMFTLMKEEDFIKVIGVQKDEAEKIISLREELITSGGKPVVEDE